MLFMPNDPSLAPLPSQEHEAWQKALHNGDDSSIRELARKDDPAASLFEFETYINGMYRATRHPVTPASLPDVRAEVGRVLPYVDEVRARLGWRVRDFDLGLLRLIRKSSALSPVLGAGV